MILLLLSLPLPTLSNFYYIPKNQIITMTILTSIFITIIFKFNQGATTYKKTAYSIAWAISLGLIFLWTNTNFILPIYYILEFGTVLFMIVLLKSNTGLFGEVEENTLQTQIPYIYVFVYLFSEIILKINNTFCKIKNYKIIFIDYFKTNESLNEFYAFVLELITHKTPLFLSILFFITTSTGFIIYIKQTSLIPTGNYFWLRDIDVFQKIPNYYYGKHKNILNIFRPN